MDHLEDRELCRMLLDTVFHGDYNGLTLLDDPILVSRT